MSKKLLALTLLIVISFISIFSFTTLVKSANDIELTLTVSAASGSLNVRTEPSTTSSNVLEVLSENDIVSVFSMQETSDSYGTWYQVKSPEGKIGWVAIKYLKLSNLTHISSATTKNDSNTNRDNNINIAVISSWKWKLYLQCL